MEEEEAGRRKHQVGVFSEESFERLEREADFRSPTTARTNRVLIGREPDMTRAWVTLWAAYNRHPLWVARALVFITTMTTYWLQNRYAREVIMAFRRMAEQKNFTVKAWWPSVCAYAPDAVRTDKWQIPEVPLSELMEPRERRTIAIEIIRGMPLDQRRAILAMGVTRKGT